MGGTTFPIDTAQIVGLFMESVAYGIYLVTFFWCIRVLIFNKPKSKPKLNYPMIVASLWFFIFATLDVSFGLRHNIDAFVLAVNSDSDEVFDDVGNWINVMKMVDYVAQTFGGDAILIWRCFIVWDGKVSIVFLPILLWLGETVCGFMSAAIEASSPSRSGDSLNSHSIKPFITTMLTLTLATNVITTSLIIYRLWSTKSRSMQYFHDIAGDTDADVDVDAESKSRGLGMIKRDWDWDKKDPLARAMRLLLESGFIYTFSVGVLFVVYLSSNNAELGVSDTIVQIIGITFNLIIVRSNNTRPPPLNPYTSPPSLTNPFHRDSRSMTHSISRSLPLNQIISIHTSTITETESSPRTPVSPGSSGIIRDVHAQYRSSRRSSSKSLPTLSYYGGDVTGSGGGGGYFSKHGLASDGLENEIGMMGMGMGMGKRRRNVRDEEKADSSSDILSVYEI